MNIPHSVSIHGDTQGVHPEFLNSRLLEAQRRSWQVLDEISASLREGMTEDDGRRLCLETFSRHGVSKHWHRSYFRFARGTNLTFNDPIRPEGQLARGDIYYLDLGPVWPIAGTDLLYEGDVGVTRVFGQATDSLAAEKAKIIAECERLFKECSEIWRTASESERLTGQGLYKHLLQRIDALGYRTPDPVRGHRVSEFPHHKHSKSSLAAFEGQPAPGLWVFEVQLLHPSGEFGAFYEDLLV